MLEKDPHQEPENTDNDPKISDENMHLFVYGNLKIIDKDTGELLINKPF